MYVADQDDFQPSYYSDLLVINKSNPESIFIEKSIPVPGSCTEVEIDDENVYINGGVSGLIIFNREQPDDPILAGCYYTTGRAGTFEISGDILILADNIDWLNLESPIHI